jgi:hypothetical protein
MTEPLPDELVDSIVVESAATGRPARGVGIVTGPAAAGPVTITLKAFGWGDIPDAARAVTLGVGMSADDAGFRYPGEDLDPDEEPSDGVQVHNPLGEATVSVPAFERLMLRYFRALITGAERLHDSVIEEPWWPEFVAATEEIEGRVSSA